MKNANEIQTICKCYKCDKPGFFSTIDDDATCPLCGARDISERYEDQFPETDIRGELFFCPTCLIMFDLGCTHAENGCTGNIFNGHVIGKWEHKHEHKTTGFVYDGMPKFDSIQEWLNVGQDVINVLHMVCLNSGLHCDKAFYSKAKHPEYYDELCEYTVVQDAIEPPTMFTMLKKKSEEGV